MSWVEATQQTGQVVGLLPQPDGSVLWGVSFANTFTDTSTASSAVLEALQASRPGVSAGTSASGLTAQAKVNPGGSSLTAYAYASALFTLPAHTELLVQGTMTTSTSGPGSAGYMTPAGVSLDVGVPFSQGYAYAEVFLDVASAQQMATGQSNTSNTQTDVYSVGAYADGSTSPFLLSFRNDSAGDLSGGFSALTQVGASEISNRVPEPTSLALSMMALLALGSSLRGRRVRPTQAGKKGA
jgi:hypothetical protein